MVPFCVEVQGRTDQVGSRFTDIKDLNARSHPFCLFIQNPSNTNYLLLNTYKFNHEFTMISVREKINRYSACRLKWQSSESVRSGSTQTTTHRSTYDNGLDIYLYLT